ncbi:MAG: CAP domain-containing protein, partial [Akkermansiaceae bacterium]|nr:CAP domain-containing protein [Akkermansiaceae bacterium]
MSHRSRHLFALLLAAPLCAQEAGPPAPPSKGVLLKALQWMQSTDPERRQAAFRSVHLLGREAVPAFQKALRKALEYHERRLADTLRSRNRGGNPYQELVSISEELNKERSRLYPLIMQDWKKDKTRIDSLRDQFGKLEALYQQAARLAAADTSDLDRQIDSAIQALVDIHDQLARFEGQTREEAARISDEERKRNALEESYDGHSYLQAARSLGAMRSEVTRLASANQQNNSRPWANTPQKNFARLISYERTVLGIGPVLLEEKLCAAAAGHSHDMRAMGFFSHASPVSGKRSFTDRARQAG